MVSNEDRKENTPLNVHGDTARELLVKGVDEVADIVKSTLGPMGRNVALEVPWRNGAVNNPPLITNDGVTIAHMVEDDDPYVNMGCELVKSAAQATQDVAGDGTTTATLMTQAIVQEGMKYVEQGIDPMQLKRELLSVLPEYLEKLRGMATVCKTREDITRVATISASDEDVGKMVGEAMYTVGKDGAIAVVESGMADSWFDVMDGLVVDGGFISPYMVTNQAKQECVMENVRVMCVMDDVNELGKEFGRMVTPIIERGETILILANNILPPALLPMLENNKVRGKVIMGGMRHPGYGKEKLEVLEDIAAYTGAHVITGGKGDTVRDVKEAWLGKAESVRMERDTAVFVGGGGNAHTVEQRVDVVKEQAAREKHKEWKEQMMLRAARMKGKMVVLKVGAATETEATEKMLRVDDAVQATRAAMQDGIVRGGGMALMDVRDMVGERDGVGSSIMYEVAKRPAMQILENAGVGDVDVTGKKGYVIGGDGMVEFVDMMDIGVIDPVKVTMSALENATSMAAMILTTNACVIRELDEPEGMSLKRRR